MGLDDGVKTGSRHRRSWGRWRTAGAGALVLAGYATVALHFSWFHTFSLDGRSGPLAGFGTEEEEESPPTEFEEESPPKEFESTARCIGSGRSASCLFRNLYWDEGRFVLMVTKNSKVVEMHRRKAIGFVENKFLPPTQFALSVFDSESELKQALLGRQGLILERVEGTSLINRNVFTHNIGHLLFDTLYPFFVSAMRFNRHTGPFQVVMDDLRVECFAEGKKPLQAGDTVWAYIPDSTRKTGRSFRPVRVRAASVAADGVEVELPPGGAQATRRHAIDPAWVYDARRRCGEAFLSTVSGRELMLWDRLQRDSREEPGFVVKFDAAVAGTGMVGNLVMDPSSVLGASGAPLYATAAYRHRVMSAFGALGPRPRPSPGAPRLIVVDNVRFGKKDAAVLVALAARLTSDGVANASYIRWPEVGDFAAQMRLVSEVDVYVSAPGTALQYAPFLRDGSVFVALGHRMEREARIIPSFMEQQVAGGGTPYLDVVYADQISIMDGHSPQREVLPYVNADHVGALAAAAVGRVKAGVQQTPVPWQRRVSTEARVVRELCDLDPLTCQLAFAYINGEFGENRCRLDIWPELIVYEVGPWSSQGWEGVGDMSVRTCPVNRTVLRSLRRKHGLPGYGAPEAAVPHDVATQEAKRWWAREEVVEWVQRVKLTLPDHLALYPACPSELFHEAALEPADAASLQAVMEAHWPLSSFKVMDQDAGNEVSLQFIASRKVCGLKLSAPKFRIRFHGRGVARLALDAGSALTQGGVSDTAGHLEAQLNRASLVVLEPRQRGSVLLSYATGDVLELAVHITDNRAMLTEQMSFGLASLEVLWHSSEPTPQASATASADAECSVWQRVRLPWTSCDSEPGNAQRPVTWIEGRISRVLDQANALVQIPMPSKCSGEIFGATSPLTAYLDEGSCGPRGNDAALNASVCPHGAELVRTVPVDNFKVQALFGACEFYKYSVYRCRGSPGDAEPYAYMGTLEVSAHMLAPIGEAPSFGLVDPSKDLATIGAGARCRSYRPDSDKKIVLVVVGELHFLAKFAPQLQSLQCYADRHGYELRKFSGSEFGACAELAELFFRKHCTVAEWLETQPQSVVAAVVDTDVVAAVPGRGLEKWAYHPADVQLYERCLHLELMAGNYMVRNTPYAREFLRKWARYYFERPAGFSSYDNGALHLVVQEAVQARGLDRCKGLYKALTKSEQDLSDYFNFTKCALDALGPPREWHTSGGRVTIWPRFSFWAADGVYLHYHGHRGVGPVLHHGIKEGAFVSEHYYSDLTKCRLNDSSVLRSQQELADPIIEIARNYKDLFPLTAKCSASLERHCSEACIGNFSCWPLGDQEPPLVERSG